MEKLLRAALARGVFRGVSRTRSRIMGSIRGRNNRSTELSLRMALARAGISGWTLHPTSVPGRPDFQFLGDRVVVFVDGCFWHGCPKCRHAVKTNRRYWKTKISLNRMRDRRTTKLLRSRGHLVLRFWEHEVGSALGGCVRKITDSLRSVKQGTK